MNNSRSRVDKSTPSTNLTFKYTPSTINSSQGKQKRISPHPRGQKVTRRQMPQGGSPGLTARWWPARSWARSPGSSGPCRWAGASGARCWRSVSWRECRGSRRREPAGPSTFFSCCCCCSLGRRPPNTRTRPRAARPDVVLPARRRQHRPAAAAAPDVVLVVPPCVLVPGAHSSDTDTYIWTYSPPGGRGFL